MTRTKRAGRASGESGVALVEFALLLPFLAILVFGTIDLGRGFTQQNRLKNASREGAALARVRPNQLSCPGGIEDKVRAEDGIGTLSGFDVAVLDEAGNTIPGTCGTVSVGDAAYVDPGSTVIVRVEANFDVLTPFVGGVTGDPIRQRAETKVVVQG